MKVEVDVDEASAHDLVARLLKYRGSRTAPQGTPFERERAYETRLAKDCMEDLVRILERKAKSVVDTSIVDAVEQLKERTLATP